MTDKKPKQIHVMYNKQNKEWYGKQDGGERKSFTAPTQADAIERAKQIAQNKQQELSIHRKDNNQIRDKNSYGNDNFPPRG
ncbi:MAG: DUF2188 domain-containing protein [bacterium]